MKRRLRTIGGVLKQNPRRWLNIIALVAILLVAVCLRLYQFPYYPEGLNQDESSAAYESYSLLTTGKDRWGEPWPIYFTGWGSGQNVLLSYLSMPFIALFGLSPLGIRIVPMVLALLTILLLFYAVRKWHGTRVALIATLIIAVSPWHVLLSRWAIESNILPFFLMLGVAALTYVFHAKRHPWVILLAVLPFSLALYAYGISVVVVPVLLVGIAIFFRRFWLPQWKWWIGAMLLAASIAAPFALFTVKNYITHTNYGFESHMPFSVPLLPESRLGQVRGDLTYSSRYINGDPSYNVFLLVPHALNDGMVYDNVGANPPLPVVVLLLGLAGIGYSTWRAFRTKGREVSIFYIWCIAALPIFSLAAVNAIQINALFIPLIVLASIGLIETTKRIQWRYLRISFFAIVCAAIVVQGLLVYKEYLSPANDSKMATNYRPGFKLAFSEADKVAQGAPVYVSSEFMLNYVQYLFYSNIPPIEYQESASTYANPDYKNYYFSEKRIPKNEVYYSIRPDGGIRPCRGQEILYTTPDAIVVVRCSSRS